MPDPKSILLPDGAGFIWTDASPNPASPADNIRSRWPVASSHLFGASHTRRPRTLDRARRSVLLCSADPLVLGRIVVDGRDVERTSICLVLRDLRAAQLVRTGRAFAMVPGLVLAWTFADSTGPCAARQPAGGSRIGPAGAIAVWVAPASHGHGSRARPDDHHDRGCVMRRSSAAEFAK